MKPVAVAFDLDETLAIPAVDRATILREAGREAGVPSLSREAYLDAHAANLTERTREPVFERLLDDRGTGAETEAEVARETDPDPATLARAYRERVNAALEPLPGVEELLAALRADYRVGLLTNGPEVAQRSKLRTLGWEDAFDVALVSGDLPAGKPDAAAFEALLAALDTDPAETVYVGDDVSADVKGATAAGLRAVQVIYPGGPAPHPAAAAHLDRERLVEDLPGVLAALE